MLRIPYRISPGIIVGRHVPDNVDCRELAGTDPWFHAKFGSIHFHRAVQSMHDVSGMVRLRVMTRRRLHVVVCDDGVRT